MNVFVFDIETVPDVATARRLWDLDELDDDGVAAVMYSKRQQETGGASEFLRHHLQRIGAISAVFREQERFNVWSLGSEEADEAELIRRFFEGIERYTPTLVSWNGGGFDLPVLHYRGLLHGVCAPRYWDLGEGSYADSRDFKWNNYISRYHTRHTDLMDLLALYQPRANAPLDEMARLLGFPGKVGMDGARVWEAWQQGRQAEIRDYCETDVVNTYLVYNRFRRLTGDLNAEEELAEADFVRRQLAAIEAPHWAEFLAAFQHVPK